ncbi:MAG: histidinol phosphate phosphatase domain-containing protein [Methanobrevibacter sp.]|jgi:histidinol phosphatase-like PHP family hydrolase|nr:histidinol phosphate phosphatase domain-containing protein [Methanobrevibacter sp.]
MALNKKRIDLHMHSLFSDGELLPSELARRAQVLDHEIIAITDHVDSSNINSVSNLVNVCKDINDNWDIIAIPGVEITHTPVEIIDKLAKKARELGSKIVVVHGETLAEPVISGTNLAAVTSQDVDILAHPGLITIEEAKIAKKNNVFLEISARCGHNLANGHVGKIAIETGTKLLINTDTHSPSNLITFETAEKIGLGAGLTKEQVNEALIDNPRKLLKLRGLL